MNVLLTGGTGFLGSYIARQLLMCGYNVVLPVRNENKVEYLKKIAGDISKIKIVELKNFEDIDLIFLQNKIDAVIHVAAVSRAGDNTEEICNLVNSNILFGTLILNAMQKYGVNNFINCGTSWQSNQCGEYSPFNLYASTKQAFEDILKYYCDNWFKSITLRVFDTFGPNDARNRIVNLIINSTINGFELDMTPGEQLINLLDVRDVAMAFVIALKQVANSPTKTNEIYAVNSKHSLPLKGLAAMIEDALGRKNRINWGGRPYRPNEIMVPCDSLKRLPNWEPNIDLNTTIREISKEY